MLTTEGEFMKFTNLFMSLCLGVSSVLIFDAPASARELKVGVGLPPGGAAYQGLQIFAKTLKEKSAGELDVKLFPPSLLTLSQMLVGVRDGVTDAGFFLPPMFPTELPETQLYVELAMLGTNAFAMAGAVTEYNFTCQECLAERLKYNHVYLGSASAAPYWILSTKKMATLDELKGKKLRSAAAPWSRWAPHFGVTAVSLPPGAIFEAVSQGTVDGAIQSPTELIALRLIDVVKHITVGVPSGTYHGLDSHNVNRSTWRSLTERQRRAFLDAAATSSAAITLEYVNQGLRGMQEAQKKGIQIHQASPDLMARGKAYIENDLATVAQIAEKDHAIKNASQKIARFRQLVAKWEKLTPEGNWEASALAEIYHREIFSKIDAKNYGM
jgi:TRAP-type C4-dicarboxylate transport system substrate-binding protein